MLVIKTSLRQSSIHGLGLFAEEAVEKGQTIWEYNPLVDIGLTSDQIKTLPKVAQEIFDYYGFGWKRKIWLPLDNSRFMNHSEQANTGTSEDGDRTVALKRIEKGEELTANYKKDFETDVACAKMKFEKNN